MKLLQNKPYILFAFLCVFANVASFNSCSAVTAQEFLNAVANAARRAGGLTYGNSVSVPPGNDRSSCDRLVDRALWDLGFKDIPIGVSPSNPSNVIISGASVGQLGHYLTSHGWIKIDSLEQITPGAVVIMDTSPPYTGDGNHVTVTVSYTPHSGSMTVYDHGSTDAIRNSANGPWVRGFEDSQFAAGYVIDDAASDKALASIPSAHMNGYRVPYEGYPGRGWLSQPDYSYTGVKSGSNPDRSASGIKRKENFKLNVAEESNCTSLLPQDWCKSDKGDSIMTLLNLVIDILSAGFVVTGAIGVIISGIIWMTALDNVAQVTAAKRRIFNMVIGAALFVMLDLIMGFIFPG